MNCATAFLHKNFLIQSLLQLEIVLCFRIKGYLAASFCIWIVQDCTKVYFTFVWLINCICSNQKICASYHLFQASHTQFCHIFTKLLGNKFHKVLNIFRFAFESLSQLRILGSYTNRTGVQIADSHHYTAHSYKRCCSKTEFLCTKKCCNCNITTAHQFTVCLNADTVTKSVHKQCLMGFSKSKLPWKSCIVNGASGCCTSTSIISGNQDYLCTSLCNSGCNRTNASLRNQLYRNICIFICIFQVIDQLCQVLDGIDIVMRRRGDQGNTRCGVTSFRNPWINLLRRKMSTFTRFCALCHFDLDFSCRYQITAGNTETTTGYLFDCRTSVIFCSC